jgi:hypothetical protein
LDLTNDDHQKLLTDALDATFNDKESQPPDCSGMPSSDNSVAPLNFSNAFGSAWSKRDNDDGLNLSMFSLEDEVQVQLLQTLKRLRCPMIAYDEVIKWAVRSCSRGHSFCNNSISSGKTVMDKLRNRVDFGGLTPILMQLYLPYSNVYVDVVYFSAHAVFESFLLCAELNRDENYTFHDPDIPDMN